jgi:hypothetical protein
MHELTRLAYLDALGIETYISRSPLPAAAPSRKLRIVRQPALAAAHAPERTPLRASPSAPLQAPAPTAPPELVTGAEIPVFSVLAVHLGGAYWLDEVPPGRSPGADYLQLLQSICFALGWDTAAPQLDQFNWPQARGSKLDQGVDAARAGFAGFLSGRLERLQPGRVVLLGEPDPSWYDPQIVADYRLTRTVSAWKMLRQPELKRRAWQDLQTLRNDA